MNLERQNEFREIIKKNDVRLHIPEKLNGIRVAFFQPKIPDGNYLPNLGIMYLSSILLCQGYEVRVFDENLEENIKSQIVDFSPHLFGVTSVTASINSAASFTEKIKAEIPHLICIVGGPHAFALPEETATKYNVFDYVFVGEAERTLPKFCRSYFIEKDYSSAHQLPGLVFLNKDGTITNNRLSSFLSDSEIEEIPFPAWHLLNLEKIFKSATHGLFSRGKRIMPVMTSRGCPNYCAFCCRVMGFAFRKDSVDKILAEILWLYEEFKIDEVYFEDDTFTQDKKRAMAILDGIIQLKLPIYIKFANGLRADKVDHELLTKMKESGVYWVGFGIESGSPETLEMMKKELDLSIAKKNVLLAKSLGFKVGSNCIIGFPGETKKNVQESIKYFLTLDLDSFAVVSCVPFPGTTAWQICKKNNWLTERANNYSNYWFEVFKVTPLIDTPMLSSSDLSWEIKKVYFRFYFLNLKRLLLVSRVIIKKIFNAYSQYFSIRLLRSNSRL